MSLVISSGLFDEFSKKAQLMIKILCGTRHVWIGEKGKMIKNQLKRFTNYGDKK